MTTELATLEEDLRARLWALKDPKAIERAVEQQENARVIHILKDGFYFSCGLMEIAVENGTAERCFTVDGSFRWGIINNRPTLYVAFGEFWDALPDAERLHILNLGQVHIIDTDGQVAERIEATESKWRWKQYPQLYNMADSDPIIGALLAKVQRLEDLCSTLQRQMEEVYNAPGMPGFFAARSRFVEGLGSA